MRTEQEIWKEIKERAKRIGRRGYAVDPVTLGDTIAINRLLWVLGFDDDIDEKMKAIFDERHVDSFTETSTAKEPTQ
jgi:hypothetical protein